MQERKNSFTSGAAKGMWEGTYFYREIPEEVKKLPAISTIPSTWE